MQAANARADYREVDINLDGKNEPLTTGIKVTCRKQGCPVDLIQTKAGRLYDQSPNGYGWTRCRWCRTKPRAVRVSS